MNKLAITQKEAYTLVQLDNGRANPMDLEMVKEIRDAFNQMAADDQVKGVILTGKPNFFTVGLNVIELYNFNEEEIRHFWISFEEMVLALVKFPKPLICAISGHSPAGGCVLAICADYRIMAEGKYQIGLNEIPVGILLPKHIFKLYSFWIGERLAYQYILEGKLMPPQEALAAHLIDKLVPLEQVMAEAEKQMATYLQLETGAWTKSKLMMRDELIAYSDLDPEQDFEEALTQWWSPGARAVMGAVVHSLQKK